MNDVERRQLISALISEIQVYEEKQPNGQWLKSITFKLPIIEENLNIGLDNDEHVETVILMSREGQKHIISRKMPFHCIINSLFTLGYSLILH